MKIQVLWLCCLLGLSSVQLTSAETTDKNSKIGLLVMAHGGGEDWNRAVQKAIEPLQARLPVELALGMADPHSLGEAVAKLEDEGARRIVVVRLFVSASSFLEQTEYFLGLREDPPPVFLLHAGPLPDEEEHYRSGVDPFSLVRVVRSSEERIPPIDVQSQIALNAEGLYDSPLIAGIVVERVRALSKNPAGEAVLILAHGEGEDSLDDLWQQRLSQLVREIQQVGDFREVRAQTLREDWFRKREEAEAQVRSFFEKNQVAGTSVLVVPFRVYGFGPYRAVLDGLDYLADGRGLLPHPAVTEWIQQQAEEVIERKNWKNPFKAEAHR